MSTTTPAPGVEGSGRLKKGPTWVSAKASERGMSVLETYSTIANFFAAVALQSYAADPKFKKYVHQVEKCLNSFDNVHEWADCISFLKQLLKVSNYKVSFLSVR